VEDLIYQFGLRQPATSSMEFELFDSRQWIILGLIDMRKAGLFRAVYCDANRLAIVLHSPNDSEGRIRQSISWIDALAMVEEFQKQLADGDTPHLVERKPPTRSEKPDEAKPKCQ
jgi:hypothetical protein